MVLLLDLKGGLEVKHLSRKSKHSLSFEIAVPALLLNTELRTAGCYILRTSKASMRVV
jgi:hypothetical protein